MGLTPSGRVAPSCQRSGMCGCHGAGAVGGACESHHTGLGTCWSIVGGSSSLPPWRVAATFFQPPALQEMVSSSGSLKQLGL